MLKLTERLYKLLRGIQLMLLLLSCGIGNAQLNTIGIPSIINYPKQQYQAGRQNWGICQDKNGLLYFANSDGLLTFDGRFWQLYPLPNKTIVRSVDIDEEGRIFTGGQGEIGYFQPDQQGRLVYFSLNHLVPPAETKFTDVWNICIQDKTVFFRTNKLILQYTGDRLILHRGANWSYLGKANGKILAVESTRGLLQFRQTGWEPAVRQGSFPMQSTVRGSVFIGNDSVLLTTQSHGVFLLNKDTLRRFSTPDIEHISKQHIYNAQLLSTGKIALITNLAGCYIIDTKGKYIQQFSKQEGIQNNHILSLLQDKDENIWLGLDNGIDLITYNNAIKNIFPEKEDRNSGYAAAIQDNFLYIGLSTGLYRVQLSGEKDLSYTLGKFEQVLQTKGQVWNLSVIHNRLLLGHTNGAFFIQQERARSMDNRTGFWNFQLGTGRYQNTMVAGTYSGLVVYPEADNMQNALPVNFESARFVVWHQDTIWVAHPYKGLYKIALNGSDQVHVQPYQDKQKLLSENYNKIYKIGEELILTTGNGIFSYDKQLGDFSRSEWLEKLFGRQGVSYLKADPYGNIWFCRNRKVGVVDRSGPEPRLIYLPELDDKIIAAGFEFIYPVDSSNVFIAGEKGFYHINYSAYKKNKYPVKAMIRSVRTNATDSAGLLYGGYAAISSIPSIRYRNNALHFECSAVLYGQEDNTEYQYFLEGFDPEWSAWTKKTERDYTNLPAGRYVFKVKTRNNYDNESPETSYSFEILPPWYQTWWANTLWILLIFTLLYLFYKLQQQKYRKQQATRLAEQQRKYAEEQERLQIQHQLEVEKNEREIVRLRNEKLEAEVEHKNQELASSAMNLVRKIEMLSQLKENLQTYQKQVESEKGQKEIHKLVKGLDKELDFKEEWERFTVHFDSVHSNFLQKLQQLCPALTGSELKLAAYLRLNLSSKEIAQLMNISVRGVETSRYRLRKKLELSNDTNLNGFLRSISQ